MKRSGVLFLSFILIGILLIASLVTVSAKKSSSTSSSTSCSGNNYDLPSQCCSGGISKSNCYLDGSNCVCKTHCNGGYNPAGCNWGQPTIFVQDGLYGNQDVSSPPSPPPCSPVDAVCDAPSAIACGTTQDRAGTCGGNPCSSTGIKCDFDYTCTSGFCIPDTIINTSYWTNLNGQLISASHLGDTVRMVAGGFNLNESINYSVWKTSGFWIIHWVTPLSTVFSSSLWTSLEVANGVYFTAKLRSAQSTSSGLDIDDVNDAFPVANITSPENDIKWSTNFPLAFTQNSRDEDDLLMLNWSFGDGTLDQIIINYSRIDKLENPSLGDVSHSFAAAGDYYVQLTAKEMTRNPSASAYRMIHIFQPGINVKAVISQPTNGISVGDNPVVRFNASTSYVVNCSTSSLLAAGTGFTAGNLNCTYIHAPNSRIYNPNYNYNITMNWTLTTDGAPSINVYGDWLNYDSVVDFPQFFSMAGRHIANLDMFFESR